MSDNLKLLSPVQVGPYTLRNRMVMAPLTRNRAGEGLAPADLNVEYYSQRASAGLIISEASQISPQGMGYPNTPGIHSAAQVLGWKKVADAVRARGGKMFLQLWHVGRNSHSSLQPDGALPVAPSAIAIGHGMAATLEGPKPYEVPRALETRELPGIVAMYRRAAKNAMEAGCDGVEVHAANGYLLDQFLRDGTNHRTDNYGGPVQNRAKLLLEVMHAVIDVWGSERVGVRLSPSGAFGDMTDSHPADTFSYVIGQLARLDLAYLHLMEPMDRDLAHGAKKIPISTFRPLYPGKLIANAGFNRESAEAILQSGDADLVSFGTLFLANPDLPERFRQNAPLNEPDPSTFYGGDAQGYTDYPSLAEA